MYNYDPLWKTLDEKDISTYRLLKDFGLSKGTLDSLKKNKNVTMNTIDWLCQVLQVPIEAVVEITLDEARERAAAYHGNFEKYTADTEE